MEKEILMPRTVWEGLKGKKIILAGNACELRQRFRENLVYISASLGDSFEVSSELPGTDTGHCVFLFSYPEKMDQLLELLELLGRLETARPQAAVLISDNRVYGKNFGSTHPLGTDEIGYACHALEEDTLAANLRTAEHFACRLAREEGLDIRVARADGAQSGDMLAAMVEASVRVLLEEASGAVYNLPMETPEDVKERSPLSPIPIITATGK